MSNLSLTYPFGALCGCSATSLPNVNFDGSIGDQAVNVFGHYYSIGGVQLATDKTPQKFLSTPSAFGNRCNATFKKSCCKKAHEVETFGI